MPSGTLVLAHFREEMREALRAGGATGLLPHHHPDRALPSEGDSRRARSVTSSAANPCTSCRAARAGVRGRRTSCRPGAPRPGIPAPSRKGALLHESRCIPPSGVGYVRRDCSRPSAPSWPLRRSAALLAEVDVGVRGPAHLHDPGLAVTLTGGGDGPGWSPRRRDDVRPIARGPERP
jgi:hypothetical protein